MVSALRVVLLFVISFGVYLFFAGEVSTVEVIAGLVTATASTALGVGLVAVAKKHFRLAPPPRAILRPLAALVPETVAVGRQLARVALRGARGQQGGFIQQPFEPGGDDPRSAGRRAAAIIGVSLAPRTFVIRGERGNALLLHGWPEKRASADKTWPA